MAQPSPELMKLVAGGAGKSGPPMAAESPDAGSSAPAGAPMTTPQPAEGDKQNAMVNVGIARDLLEQTLPALGSESPEGQAVMKVLGLLTSKFGHTHAKSQELMPAEIQQLVSSLPKAGGPPGGPPPGMPPGGAPMMPH